MSYTCSWLRLDACSLSLGPELPVPVFLPHKVKLFSQGNPYFYFLINQIFPVHLAQTRAAGQLPKGRSGLPGRVCLGPLGGSPPSTGWRTGR